MANSSISAVSSVMNSAQTSTASNLSTSKSNSSSDFGKVMSQSISSYSSKNQDYNDSSKNFSGNATKTTTSSTTKTDSTSKSSAEKAMNNASGQTSQKIKESASTNKAADVNDDKKVDDMLDSVKEKIKDVFNITDDQIEAAMASLGITMQDLLQPNNLTNLVAQITGSDNVLALLTDGDLSNQLKQIMDFVSNVVNDTASEMGISTEELLNFVSESSQDSNQDSNPTSFGEILNDKTSTEENSNVVVQAAEEGTTQSQQKVQDNNSEQSSTQDTLQSVIEEKVTVETSSSDGDSSPKENTNDNSNDNTNHNFSQVTNNLTQSIQEVFKNVNDTTGVDTTQIIRQIVDAAKVTVSQQVTSMEIQLNPENLGKINLTIMAKEGVITAQLTAENETVKKALENQMSVLKDNFNNQGLKVDSVEVTVQSHAFDGSHNLNKESSDNNQNGKKSHKHLNIDSLNDLNEEDLSDEEKGVMNMLKDSNSSVEYTA